MEVRLITYMRRWFENFIIFSILLNSVVLALYDYSDRENVS